MKAAIISTGDELMAGHLIDSNAAWLSQRLNEAGITVVEHLSLGDDKDALKTQLQRIASYVDIILATGGLGPTADDLTRFAVAEMLGVELECHEESLEVIQQIFKRFGRPMSETNRYQAMIPQGCSAIANSCGTAPGIRAEKGSCTMYFMPGVPSEMKAMYDSFVLPELTRWMQDAGYRSVICSRTLHTMGMGESMLGEAIADLMARGKNPSVNTNAGSGQVKVRIRAQAENRALAEKMIAETEQEIRNRLGDIVWGVDNDSLPEMLVKTLTEKQKTLATVESCTGGLISKYITDIPGSSAVLLGGWCVYSNEMKMKQLKVAPQLLEQYGAVSEQVACELAINGRDIAGSDYCLSTTGVAGPGGGTEEKPVGLVYYALAGPDGLLMVDKTNLSGSREIIRNRTANRVMNMLLKVLNGQ